MPEAQLRRDGELPTDREAQIRWALSFLSKAVLALATIIVVGTAGYMVVEDCPRLVGRPLSVTAEDGHHDEHYHHRQ